MCVGLLVLGSAAASGKLCRLRDPLLTIDAAGKRKIGSDPANLASHPCGDLVEVKDAEFVQALLVDRTDALDPLQVVRTAPARGLDGEAAECRQRPPFAEPWRPLGRVASVALMWAASASA